MPDQPLKQDNAPTAPVAELGLALSRMDREQPPGQRLLQLIDAGLDRLPLPGGGDTLRRWECLALVARHDLSLLKLYEGHTDALAIMAELGAPSVPRSAWGVWCAEPPGDGVTLHEPDPGSFTLSGRKQWCSGAATVSHALVSCRDQDGKRWLAAVDMGQAGVTVTPDGWHAVGMAACDSVDVLFQNARAVQVGAAEAYLNRAGFWHGGAGIAACWYGAAQALADHLHAAVREQAAADPHRLAHLGHVDIAMEGAAALLRETAAAIDADPYADASTPALRVRLSVESAASTVLQQVTRALGAGPLCRDAAFARMAADLPVFLRQSHAERDLAALGAMLAKQEHSPWLL